MVSTTRRQSSRCAAIQWVLRHSLLSGKQVVRRQGEVLQYVYFSSSCVYLTSDPLTFFILMVCFCNLCFPKSCFCSTCIPKTPERCLIQITPRLTPIINDTHVSINDLTAQPSTGHEQPSDNSVTLCQHTESCTQSNILQI